jgi:hypothetical protein
LEKRAPDRIAAFYHDIKLVRGIWTKMSAEPPYDPAFPKLEELANKTMLSKSDNTTSMPTTLLVLLGIGTAVLILGIGRVLRKLYQQPQNLK